MTTLTAGNLRGLILAQLGEEPMSHFVLLSRLYLNGIEATAKLVEETLFELRYLVENVGGVLRRLASSTATIEDAILEVIAEKAMFHWTDVATAARRLGLRVDNERVQSHLRILAKWGDTALRVDHDAGEGWYKPAT